jgi:hypothetical protein
VVASVGDMTLAQWNIVVRQFHGPISVCTARPGGPRAQERSIGHRAATGGWPFMPP